MLKTSIVLSGFLLSSVASAGEFPFSKETKVDTKIHRYVPTPMFLVDLDGDKDLDIVASTPQHYGEITWFENKKKGKKWVERQISKDLKIPFEPKSILVADVDGDKDLDVVTVLRYRGVHWYENKKRAKKWKRHEIVAKTSGVSEVAIGDLDGDDDNDLLLAGKGLFWLENVGKRKFDEPQQIYDKARGAYKPTLVDVDGDEDLDVLFVGETWGRSGLLWMKNEGGPFTVQMVRGEQPADYTVTDFDDDGDVDIVAAFGKEVRAYLNHEGTGVFAEMPLGDRDKDAVYREMRFSDVDRDGERDVVIAGQWGAEQRLVWLKNPGDLEAPWTSTLIKRSGATFTSLSTGDIDRDGDHDILVGEQGAGEWRHQELWLNNKSKKKKKKKRKKKRRR